MHEELIQNMLHIILIYMAWGRRRGMSEHAGYHGQRSFEWNV